MFSQVRYQQQFQQFYNRIVPGTGTVAIYKSRDTLTGHRTIETADGGRSMAQYLSNSVPSPVLPIARSSSIGLPGYASQKPH